MDVKIQDFFKLNKININILQKIESLQVITYYLSIENITPLLLNKIEKMQKALCLYLQKDNIKISFDNKKGLILLEIPTEQRKTLYYNELIKNYTKQKNGLYCNIGINTENTIKNVNLCEFPHLLIAGTTGSGKSVLVNTIILQLLENYTPKELELILIDIKQVEFSIYKDIPHLLYKPVTTLEDTRKILEQSIEDMTARYETLKNNNCRNIIEYNNKNINNKMAYKLIIIDELAELLLLEKNSLKANLEGYDRIEKYICRLAQLGRAAGLHLIVATQRPSSDVVSGLIKSNIPSKIALTVANKINSKIILDEAGAETLTGKGDYLIKAINENKTERLQGAYITESEILEKLKDIKNKYNYNNTLQNIDKKDILQLLSDYIQERFKNANSKKRAYEILQQDEYIKIIIKDIAENEQEQKTLYNNYFNILNNVKRYYNGYIMQEKEQEKAERQEERQRQKQEKIKRRDDIISNVFIANIFKNINKHL